MNTKVHPEVFREVVTEFRKLHEKNPSIAGDVKWRMARQFVRACALGETALLMNSLMGL